MSAPFVQTSVPLSPSNSNPTVIIVVFIVQLALHLISTFGKQAVNDTAWWMFTKLPIQQTPQAQEQVKLRNEVTRLQREMAGVSAQDNFAKWARLRRDHDKVKEKYEKEANEQKSSRSSFDSIVSKLRWVGTQGVNFMLNTWFASKPMFWMPQGWVPYSVEWILSFPKAPLGSVSVNVWGIACGTVVGMLVEVLMALWTLRTGEVKTGSNKGEKIKMPSAPVTSKKEL